MQKLIPLFLFISTYAFATGFTDQVNIQGSDGSSILGDGLGNQYVNIASIASTLTLPVSFSGGITANAGTNLNTSALSTSANQTNGTQITQVSSLPALPAGSNSIGSIASITGSVTLPTGAATSALQSTINTTLGSPMQNTGGTVTITPPAITKGTQGTTGVSVQELKDGGRTNIALYATAAASGTTTTETAITLTKSILNTPSIASTSSAASFVVTNGKTFRITSMVFATLGNATATVQKTTFSFRVSSTGAVTTATQPIVFQVGSATPATASSWDRYQVSIPDGYEIQGNGTVQFGVTANSTFVTNAPTWYCTITGFEY